MSLDWTQRLEEVVVISRSSRYRMKYNEKDIFLFLRSYYMQLFRARARARAIAIAICHSIFL